MIRALAHCQGANCAPDRVQLIVSAAGTQQLVLSGVNGELVMDGARIPWTRAEARSGLGHISENQVLQGSGRFAMMTVQMDRLL